MGIDGRIYPVSATPKKREGELEFMGACVMFSGGYAWLCHRLLYFGPLCLLGSRLRGNDNGAGGKPARPLMPPAARTEGMGGAFVWSPFSRTGLQHVAFCGGWRKLIVEHLGRVGRIWGRVSFVWTLTGEKKTGAGDFMFDKVLILSASAGAGHLRAAQAMEKAFVQLHAAKEVRNIDTLDYTNKLFQRFYSKTYIELVNKAPDVLGWFYDRLDTPWENERLRLTFDKLNTRPFVKMLQEYQPDIVVCTHFLPAEIISWLRAKEKLKTRQAIVVTDFDVHAMWLCHHYEHYFVALDETRVLLEELGIPAGKITVSGISIDPVFAEEKDRHAMRVKHGLEPALPTILLSAGGFGMGPIDKMVQALTTMKTAAQVVAVCGRNEELRQRMQALANGLPADCKVRVVPIGYTTEIDEYMSASDILLGKPGGLTSSEALAKGLAFVIVNPIRGQEERNSDHLLEKGAAIRCNNLPVLAYKIDTLLGDAERLSAMKANSRRLGRPDAACEIVRKLVELQKR